ncbi:MAG: glycosyltransferase family 2 protein [Tepidisphaeraceae bacterium]|jgi:GT2 family glycosyltransferase
MMRVAILIACYNGRECLGDCLRSLLDSRDPDVDASIILIDNASTDSSADFVERQFPQVELIRLKDNRGFAGGINAGWEYARRKFPDLQYVAAINQDIIAQSGWLAKLAGRLRDHPSTAAVQPKVLLWPQKDRFNTAGNRSHFLGFGLVTAYGELDDGSFNQCREIDFPSGAAVLIRAQALGGREIFDELFFLYLEDAELGWKLRQLGHRIDYVPDAVIWHQYRFHRDFRFYFYLERNRWYLLATYYKMPTLLLLLPAILVMEMGQLYFAWRNRVLGQKLAAWAFFASPRNVSRLLRRRREAQLRRRIGDRQFLRAFVGEIDLPELRSQTLRRIGNPILRTYWRFARPLIFW